jgi:hypothetical protein
VDTKTLFGLTVIPAAIVGGVVVTCLSNRLRDLFFMFLVFTGPMIERLDLNFASREWYRGTSRGFEVSVLDIIAVSLLVSAILVPRRGEARVYWPAGFGVMLLYLIYAGFNVAVSDPKLFGLFELFKLVRGLVVYLAVAFYLRSERELRLLIFALGLAVCYQALLALKQRYVEGVHRVFGTVDDSNSLSVFLCTTAPIFVAALNCRLPRLLKWLSAAAVVLACVAQVLTISRAGVIIVAVVTFGAAIATVSFRVTTRKVIYAGVVMLAAAGLTAKSWKTLSVRFHESTLQQEYGNKRTLGRGYYIRIAMAIAEEKWFGVGLNNWSYWVSNRYGPKLGYHFVPYKGTDLEPSDVVPDGSNVDEAQAAPAHSLGALTMGELGWPGFVLFTLVWLRWFQMGANFLWRRTPDPLHRMGVGLFFALCGIFLQSLTEWVFRQSPIYYVIHVLLGALASLYYLKKLEYRVPLTQRERANQAFYAGSGTPATNW